MSKVSGGRRPSDWTGLLYGTVEAEREDANTDLE